MSFIDASGVPFAGIVQNFMGRSLPRPPKWLGQPVPTPSCRGERGQSPCGRQRHYAAVEIVGGGQKVFVNDVVEILATNHSGNSERQPRLAQVLSMWEDTFTGVFKFRGRYLVHSRCLSEDASSRLREVRRALSAGCSTSGGKSPIVSGGARDDDGESEDEVFLTPRADDLEVQSIVHPVTLSVTVSAAVNAPSEPSGNIGPRLTHALDESPGEFVPLGGKDAILTRARARQEEAATSMTEPENEAADGNGTAQTNGRGKSGWLPPSSTAFPSRTKRSRGGSSEDGGSRGGISRGRSATHASTDSVITRSTRHQTDADTSDEGGRGGNPDSTDEKGEQDDDSDGHTTGTDGEFASGRGKADKLGSVSSPRKSPRKRKSKLSPPRDTDVEDSSQIKARLSAPHLATTPQRRRNVVLSATLVARPPRPRRLAMPLASDDPRLTPACESTTTSAVNRPSVVGTSRIATRRATSGAVATRLSRQLRSSSTEASSTSEVRPFISAKRKRGDEPRGTTKAAGAYQSDYPPRRTPVGKAYQAEIPDLLCAEDRTSSKPGTGARMVWKSIREWTPHSRTLLADYLRTAREVVHGLQAQPGVPVHVRLGGGGSSSDRDGAGAAGDSGATGSYAVWAITSGRDNRGVVRVACSEMAQTELPKSAIQKVQCDQEALTALVKTKCVLQNVEPALELLADNRASPQSIETWTLIQARTLEKLLEKEFDPERRPHDWSGPDTEVDREDFIDLAKVSKQIPGKTPSQEYYVGFDHLDVDSKSASEHLIMKLLPPTRVGISAAAPELHPSSSPSRRDLRNNTVLSFYYKYFAAAEPLTDVVYGPEAAEVRRCEPLSRAANLDGKKEPGVNLNGGDGGDGGDGCASEAGTKSTRLLIRLPGPKPADSAGTVVDGEVARREGGSSQIEKVQHGGDTHAQQTSAARRDSTVPPTNAGGGQREGPGEENGRGRQSTKEPTGARPDEMEATRDGGDKEDSIQNRRQRTWTMPKKLPPNIEVLEVEDSGDENYRGRRGHLTSQGSALAAPGRGEPKRSAPASDVATGYRRPSSLTLQSMSPGDLWVSGELNRKPVNVAASGHRPFRAQTVPARPTPSSRGVFRVGTRPPALAPSERGFQSGRWEAQRSTKNISGGMHERPLDRPHQAVRADGGGDGIDQRRAYGGRVVDERRVAHSGMDDATRGGAGSNVPDGGVAEDDFGAMAPCWRLLERAKEYMDPDQRIYMKGLLLAHAKKPMTRDQLMERARSCLQDQDKIVAAFTKMYDRIDQHSLVPLYPARRNAGVPPPSTSYSPGISPASASTHGGMGHSGSDPFRVSPHPSGAVGVGAQASRYAGPAPGSGVAASYNSGVYMTPSSPHPGVAMPGYGLPDAREVHMRSMPRYGNAQGSHGKGDRLPEMGVGGAPFPPHVSAPPTTSSAANQRAVVYSEACAINRNSFRHGGGSAAMRQQQL